MGSISTFEISGAFWNLKTALVEAVKQIDGQIAQDKADEDTAENIGGIVDIQIQAGKSN